MARLQWRRDAARRIVAERSRPHRNALYSPAEARVLGPPNFEDPVPQHADESPPTYIQIRNIERPEIAALIPPERRAVSDSGLYRSRTAPSMRSSAEPRTSCNLTSLEDIRYEEVGHTIHMNARVTAVPQDPVPLWSSPSIASIETTRASLTPIARLETSTPEILVSIAQLPGAEPLDALVTPERLPLRRSHTAPPSRMSPASSSDGSIPPNVDISTNSGQTALAQQQLQSPAPQQGLYGSSRTYSYGVSSYWDDPWIDFAPLRWGAPAEGYYAPAAREVVSTSGNTRRPVESYWNQQSNANHRSSVNDSYRLHLLRQQQPPLTRREHPARSTDSERPPPVPPKDPGYVPRPRLVGNRPAFAYFLRQSRSSPQLRAPLTFAHVTAVTNAGNSCQDRDIEELVPARPASILAAGGL